MPSQKTHFRDLGQRWVRAAESVARTVRETGAPIAQPNIATPDVDQPLHGAQGNDVAAPRRPDEIGDEQALREYLAPIPDTLGEYLEHEPWGWEWGRKGLFKCNWKLQVDSQSEGYHARFLHARSIIAKFTKDDTPTWTHPDSIGVPLKLEVHRPAAAAGAGVFLSPLANAVGRYPTALYYNTDNDDYRGSVTDRYPGALNSSNAERWAFDIYQIFPNTVILVQKGHLMIMRS